jgi:hypothetical protein
MSLLSRFSTLKQAGFLLESERKWRHDTFSYLTVECQGGTWTMRSPSDCIEIVADADIEEALKLLKR